MLNVSDDSQAVWMSSKLGFYLGSSLWKLQVTLPAKLCWMIEAQSKKWAILYAK